MNKHESDIQAQAQNRKYMEAEHIVVKRAYIRS